MEDLRIYHYHPVTKEYLKEGLADKSPLDDDILVPAHATRTPPIESEEGKVTVFLDDEWQNIVIPDNVEIENELTPEELVNLERNRILSELAVLDTKLTRSSEDLYDLLVAQEIISESDLPHLRLTKERKVELRVSLATLNSGGAE